MNNTTKSYRPIGIRREYRRSMTSDVYIEAVTDKEISGDELTGRYNALLIERNEQQREIEALRERVKELESQQDKSWPNPFLLSGDELDRAERELNSH